MSRLAVVILAAGQGKRMCSALPKVLHPVGGMPMLERVVRTAQTLAPVSIHVVYGNGGLEVRDRLQHLPVTWVEQKALLGTGYAVQQAMPLIDDACRVLVLYGDVPLVSAETLQTLLQGTPADALGALTATPSCPAGLGRVVRDTRGRLAAIVEERDATPVQREITEVNTGILTAPAAMLKRHLPALERHNAQGEYYLTDVIAMAAAEEKSIGVLAAHAEEVMGVNDRGELAAVERAYQHAAAHRLMQQGVTICDPARFDLRGDIEAEPDSVIDVNVICEGRVSIGTGSVVGPHTSLRDAKIGRHVRILSHCVIEGAVIGDGCVVGPFARIRPGTELKARVHIGNFVELKKAAVDEGSKANHHAYLGDVTIGKDVNIGAGTITCNYDGAHKHPTVIQDGAFIGSDTMLVAPVTVGAGATIGAGSTITRDAPAGQLTVARAKQCSLPGWKRPVKS